MKKVNIMKKILAFILAFALCTLSLCSCSADAAEINGAYKIQENIYYASLVDSAYNPDDGYTVTEKDGKTLLLANHTSISGEAISTEIGELKSFSLKKSNFDDVIFGDAWQNGTSAEGLRKANKAAWKAEKKGEGTFYVLLQKDDTVLISFIEAKAGVKSCAYVRKIAK